MKKWHYCALGAIFLLGLMLRLLPLFRYPFWGSDTGEYYYLTEQLLEQGYISFDYTGWGFCYPYFPGLFALSAGTALSFSSDLLGTLLLLAPIISSLSVILVFFITRDIFQNLKAGLLAALLSSVAIPHVFTTSHPMPGSLGDFLLLFCILLFLKSYQSKNFLPLLYLSTLALVLTHHFSTYFLFITLILFVFIRELFGEESALKLLKFELIYLAFLFIAMITYWFWIAERFREIITDAFDVGAEIILALTLLAFFLGFLIIKLKRKLHLRRYSPKEPSYKKVLGTYCIGLGIGFSGLFISAFVNFPGTAISIDKIGVLLFAPSILIFSLAVFGTAFSSKYYKGGMLLFCWLLALAGSLFLGIATSNTVLIPYRHLQYIIVPLAIFAGFGSLKFIELATRKNAVKIFIVCSFTVLLVLAPWACYPPRSVLGGFEEGTPEQDINSLVWAREYLGSKTIASDHRLSSMLFGFAGAIPSWEFVSKVFHSANSSEVKEELGNAEIPAGRFRINYVVIDEVMREGVCLKQWEPAKPMSRESLEKFENSPFLKIYDDGFTQIYMIIWEQESNL